MRKHDSPPANEYWNWSLPGACVMVGHIYTSVGGLWLSLRVKIRSETLQ